MVSWKWQDVLGFLWGESKRQTELLAQILRSLEAKPTPSSGEETESSPQEGEFLRGELDRLWKTAQALERRLAALEAGPPSPPATAKPTSTAPSDADPCPICQLPQKSGPHRHPMAPAPEPDSPPASTAGPTLNCPTCGQSTVAKVGTEPTREPTT